MENKKLHQRLTAGILLLAIATAAYAGVYSTIGEGSDRPLACTIAKNNARNWVENRGKTVTGYSQCECEKRENQIVLPWICSVDAYYND